MATLSHDEMVRALMAQYHISRDKATEIADRQAGVAPARATTPAPRLESERYARALTLPVSFTIPWSHLVSDDAKYGVLQGRIILKQRYREMKSKIRGRVRKELGNPAPVTYPVALHARVFVPDNRPHDVPNFGKIVHDALEKVIYPADSKLYSAHWERAGVDVDAPRAEITIRPFIEDAA